MARKSDKPAAVSRSVTILVAVVIGLVLAAVSLYLMVGRGAGLATNAGGGFLGTRATTFADINLVAEIVLLLGLLLGYGFARRGNIPAHQYNQTAWVLFNLVLVIFIMTVSFSRQVVPGIPANLLRTYYSVSTVHSVLGTVTVLCAVYILLRMNRLLPKALRISWWKNLMRLTLGLYWMVGLLGIGTYYVWYVAPREAVAPIPEATQVAATDEGRVVLPMANYAYVPPDLTVPVGTTVVFRNDDPDPHTVTFDQAEFDAFGFEQGSTHEIKFDQLGTYQYYCEFHGSPGLRDMAGVIRVVPADQLAAAPTEAPVPTQTPPPTAAPVAAEPLGPVGFGDFQDARARNDRFVVSVVNLPAAATEPYHAWLVGDAAPLSLGTLSPGADASAQLAFVDPQGRNLLAHYSSFIVTLEAAGAPPSSPSANVVVGGSVPLGALGPARQLLVEAEAAPERRALALGLIIQAEEMFRHARAVNNAALAGDVDSLNRHLEHVFAILDGQGGPHYRDWDGDGFITDPGDGFGIGNYGASIEAQAQAASASPDATENVKLHAAQLIAVTNNVRAWARELADHTLQAHVATSADAQKAAAARAYELSRQILDGVDADADGEVEPVTGEGGAFTIYFQSQYLAAMGALRQEAFASATQTVATMMAMPTVPSGATNTPAPPPTPMPSPTRAGPPVIVYRNFEILPAETTIKVGTRVLFLIRDSLHQPYNFTAPNVFEAPANLGDGQSVTFTFDQVGTVTLLCGYHSRMQATLVVMP